MSGPRCRPAGAMVVAVSLLLGPTGSAIADEAMPTEAGRVSLYDARSVGAVVDFHAFAPQAVFPFPFQGGLLASTSVATSSPRGFGFAGMAPVPAATSVGIIIPEKNPFTGEDVPPEVREAFKSVDYTQLPTGCQALFPPVREGGDEVNCGGPNQDDPALAFTYAGFNGYSRATGNLDDPLASRTLSRSRAEDIGLPSLQASIRQASTQGLTAVNDQGLPQAEASAYVDTLNLAGALVRLEGISSHTLVATDGTEAGTAARTSLTVRAASVGGVPVVVGPDGIAVDKNQVEQTSLKPLSERVELLLRQAGGLSVRLVAAPRPQLEGNEASAESASLLVSYAAETPTPLQVSYRVGYTKAVVNAVPAMPAEEPAGPADDAGTPLPETAVPSAIPTRSAEPPPSLSSDPNGSTVMTAAATPREWSTAPAGRADTHPASVVPPGDTTDRAARNEVVWGDPRLLQPTLASSPSLPQNGMRRLYAGLLLLALGGAGFVKARRLAWLQPDLRGRKS